MNRESRAERMTKARRKAKIFAGVTLLSVVLFIVYLLTQKEQDIDHQGCPKETGPSREVVVLLDTSDPLGDKHKAELRRIVGEMTSPSASGRHDALAVRKGERVTIYRLESTGAPDTPIAQICHPGGNPEERRRSEQLTKGTVITEWRWEQFVKVIEAMFPAEERVAQPSSPILETIAVISARHASSRRAAKGAKPTHLVVISDLLQNTELLSHYKPYPNPEEIPRELRTDLSRVEVSLFQLERHKYELSNAQALLLVDKLGRGDGRKGGMATGTMMEKARVLKTEHAFEWAFGIGSVLIFMGKLIAQGQPILGGIVASALGIGIMGLYRTRPKTGPG